MPYYPAATGIADGDKGDITVSGNGTVFNLDIKPTGTIVGTTDTQTLTGKTYDTAGTGNVFSINGVAVTSNTGTGAVVRENSPVLVTPALGTPSSATLTNATGLPVSTGISGFGTNVAAFLGTPSSANLAAALTDETGTGANVFGTSPTIATPVIDQFGTSSGLGAAWSTWIPTWTNLTLGTGFNLTARYKQIGKVVEFYIQLTLGTSPIVGDVYFSLPVSAHASFANALQPMGNVMHEDVGTAWFYGPISYAATDKGRVQVFTANGTYSGEASLSSTVPFTWVAGDKFKLMGRYEAA